MTTVSWLHFFWSSSALFDMSCPARTGIQEALVCLAAA
jgi:hypothetical protein